MSALCPSCSEPVSLSAKFCSECGAAIAPAVSSRGLAAKVTAERRQLTILFCDLVGSTALSERLELDVLRQLVSRFHTACSEEIRRLGGYVAQYLGDGILAYFGYPAAHDDDAARAVRAGLGILAAVRTLHDEMPDGAEVRVRVGIHTGSVVIGEIRDDLRGAQLALGEGPNTAARVQQCAEPNQALVSETTHRLTSGFFEYDSAGTYELKGVSKPMRVYRVLAETGAQSRVEATRAGLTPFVGRTRELHELRARFERARNGTPSFALVRGDPGIGKSRLIEELKQLLQEEPLRVMECRCSPLFETSPLRPFVDWLARHLGFTRDLEADHKAARLGRFVESQPALPEGALTSLLALNELPTPEEDVTPKQKRQRTLATLRRLVSNGHDSAPENGTPTLLVVEDVHWADPSSLELLEPFVSGTEQGSVFVLATARPEFRSPWDTELAELRLEALPEEDTRLMIESVAGSAAVPPAVLREMIGRTEGIPLFAEELTRDVLESGVLEDSAPKSSPMAGVPVTVQDSLTARLDRTGPSKSVAQLASVLGRDFPFELLLAVSDQDEATLGDELARLESAALLRRGGEQDRTYSFSHALVRDAAYTSLLKNDRQRLHGHIAHVLRDQFPNLGTAQPELLAHHYTGAGLHQEALGYWMVAGQRSAAASAYAESCAHFDMALSQTHELTDSPLKTQQELMIRGYLGSSLITLKGFAAPEVEQNFGAARTLVGTIDEAPLPVLYGIWAVQLVRSDPEGTEEIAQHMARVADSSNDPLSVITANGALGTHDFFGGRFEECRQRLEKVMAAYDPNLRDSVRALFGSAEVLFYGHVYTAWCDVLGGDLPRGVKRCEEALELAKAIEDPSSISMIMGFSSAIAQAAGDVERCGELAERMLDVAQEYDLSYWTAVGHCYRGWAKTRRGDVPGGVAELEEGVSMYRTTGARLVLGHYLTLMCDAYLVAGRIPEATSTLEEAEQVVDGGVDQYSYAPEMLRLREELQARQGLASA